MMESEGLLLLLAGAMVLDALFGEPDWLWKRVPHPVVIAGRAIGWLDRRMNLMDDSQAERRRAGILAIVILVLGAGLLGTLIENLPFGGLLAMLGAAILLAQRSLASHVIAVADAMEVSLPEARAAVARIVGRDPESLDEAGVARAAIESAAENFSDGVVAPAFWFAIAGLPGIMVYKLVNTADSMIGHRTPRHEAFGWAAARLDDLMNLIPARLTALLFLTVAMMPEKAGTVWRDAPRHRSPNAGWPEAALAAALGLALAGPRRYGSTTVDDPWMNPEGRRTAGTGDIRRAVGHVWRAFFLGLGLVLVLGLLL
ncbi:MAG: adenosylcobinamide-phosphate synthase CbiB [Minwuia sp.]|nr:adenosylcobinamide-phosphate synthase CbiB [Minwuia sp.]